MIALPGATKSLYFEVHNALSNNVLVDASAIVIVVKDPTWTTRIAYSAARLTHVSTGVYRYYFTVPSIVVIGDWHVNMTITVGAGDSASSGVRNVHFTVREV